MSSDPQENHWPGTTILIAEDDEFSYQFFKAILKQKGPELIRAKNGAEALEIFGGRSDINLIFMDMQLPEVDGFEVTRRIREADPDIPIIAQTAYIHDDEREKCLEAGCNAYISKPLDLNKLLGLVGEFLQK